MTENPPPGSNPPSGDDPSSGQQPPSGGQPQSSEPPSSGRPPQPAPGQQPWSGSQPPSGQPTPGQQPPTYEPYPGAAGQYPPQPYPGGYPPPPGGYPGPPGPAGWEEPKGKGLAITALVLGILALLTCWTVVGGIIFGLLALIFGIIATVKSRRGTSAGGGMAIAGLVLGLLGLIAAIVITVIGVNFFVNHGGRDYFDCVNDAQGDRAKIEQCQRDWNHTLQNDFSVTLTPQPTR